MPREEDRLHQELRRVQDEMLDVVHERHGPLTVTDGDASRRA